MNEKIPCTFVSVWDGGLEIDSAALYDPDTNAVTGIQTAELPAGLTEGLEHLEREYIRVSGHVYDVRRNDDGEYTALHTYGVFFQREGYAEVQATSPEEAMRIADETLTDGDVSWNEDWPATYAQSED
jgi:glycyl-tRNA synthetase alpha subunit